MSVKEIAVSGAGGLLVLMTLVQIAPMKISPWSALAKMLGALARAAGRAVNGSLLQELDAIKQANTAAAAELQEIKAKLESHITTDEQGTADGHRARILHFNNELLRDLRHTKEEFIEALAEIDAYEAYCAAHPEYPNNRAVLAIENIRQCYRDRMQKHDFLQGS